MSHVDKLKEKLNLTKKEILPIDAEVEVRGEDTIHMLMQYFQPNYKLKRNNHRIAVCFTGQIRTGVEVAPMMKDFFGELYNELDFFIHTWDTESFSPWAGDRSKMNADEARKLIPVDLKKIEKIKEIYDPIGMIVDNLSEYKRTHPGGVENRPGIHHQIAPWWISGYECNKLKKKYELLCGVQYFRVLRIRFDVIFTPKYRLIKELMYMASYPNALYSVDRHNRLHEAIEDIAWLSTGEIIDKVNDFVLNREEKSLPLGAMDDYTHFQQYLIENKIYARPFKNNDVYLYRDFDVANNLSPYDKPLNNDETTLQ